MDQPCATLFTGCKIPLLGLGTWKSSQNSVRDAVRCAVLAGYRHIDCAWAYKNEAEVGVALGELMAEGAVRREELFITSKLWNSMHRPKDVRPALQATLANLRLDYLDLYLVHWPMGFAPIDGDSIVPRLPDGSVDYDDIDYLETWGAMEALVGEGLVRHIGLSNFNSEQISRVLSKCTVHPAALQCESHPYLTQKELIAYAQKNNIVFQAYCPLGSPDRPWAKPGDPSLLQDPRIVDIGRKYGKSAAQVLIRFQVERGVCVLPKSVTPARIAENFNIMDFILTGDEMSILESFNRNWRACLPTVEVNGQAVSRDRNHPHYPFHAPF